MKKIIVICSLLLSTFAQGYWITVQNNTNGEVLVSLYYDRLFCSNDRKKIQAGKKHKFRTHGKYDLTGMGCCLYSINTTKLNNVGENQNKFYRLSKTYCKSKSFTISDSESGIVIE